MQCYVCSRLRRRRPRDRQAKKTCTLRLRTSWCIFRELERSERISAARENAPVGAGAVETALAGRAAWGVLGSAAGGHVFVLGGETHVLGGSFGGNRKKKRVAEL